MILEKVVAYKGNTWMIQAGNGQTAFCDVTFVRKYGLREGMTMTETDWSKFLKMIQYEKIRKRARYMLDRKDYSFMAMYQRLREHENYDEKVCLQVCKDLAAAGYVNDVRYARQLASMYLERKHYGKAHARQEMHRKGLLSQQIEDALEAYTEDEMTAYVLEMIRQKYVQEFSDPKDFRAIQKGKAALLRRGYSYEEVQRAMKKYFVQLEDEEE